MRGPELPIDDLYARLELPTDAAPEAIEIAWRALLKLHHPDVAGEASLETAKRINIAHDWLSDPVLRARYDRSRGELRGLVRSRSGTRAGAPPAARPAYQRRAASPDRGPATDRGPAADRGSATPHRHRRAAGSDERPGELGLASARVMIFLDRVGALVPDEVDRLALAEPPPLAFVASIRRFLGPDRLSTLDELDLRVGERLPAQVRAVPAARDAVTSFGQYLVLAGFLADLLSEPFLERVEERMTRGWLAAVGRSRYGPRSADVRALVARARTLTTPDGARLVAGAAALGLSEQLWPHGTDPAEDEVLRVSAALAARDATEAARAGGSSVRAQAAVASFARVLALAPAFGAAEATRLLRPWRELGAQPRTTR